MLSASLFAQATVKGIVSDDKGEPLPGATVKAKSTTRGAVSTDINGKFSITLPAKENTIQVIYLGFITQEIEVSAQSGPLKISMSSNSKNLNEVVVVGYGTQKKRDVTGAVGSISSATLTEVPATNVVDQLKGRLAGIDIQTNSTQPGASGAVRIRGERSLGTSQGAQDAQNSPLLVVDGIPFVGGSINDINPDDIASLDVLKDGSATAIYGSRGASGVILITTKRGRNGKAQMSYNAYYGVAKITSEYPLLSGQEFASLKQAAALGNSVNPGVSLYNLTSTETANLAAGVNTDWQSLVFRNGFTTDHELSLSGGNEDTQYSLSGGYHKDQGTVYGQSFERYSLRSTIDHQINKRLRVGFNTLESVSYTNGGNRFPVGGVARMSPLVSPYNTDGSVNLTPQVGSLDNTVVNPLTIRDEATNADLTRKLSTFNSLYGEVNIIDGLKYRANIGLTYNQQNGNTYSGPNEFYNTATAYANASENVNNSENWSYTIENLLIYDKTFAQKHHINFTGLYSVEKDHNQSSNFSGLGLPTDYLQYYNLQQATSVTANAGGFTERGLQSYMGRLQYSYAGKYLLTATLRDDGSSVFPSKKYFLYPAVSLGWNIGDEEFMKKQNVISSLKLRGGWAKTSNQSVGAYSSLGSLSTNFYNFGSGTTGTNANGYFVSTLGNQELTWEFTNSFNAGLDFSLLKGRISGTVDVYAQNTSDILQQVKLPPSNGATSVFENLGKTKGKGLEISLSTQNILNPKGFNWSTDVNISFNRNEIVALHDGIQQDLGNDWFVGQPFNVIYDLKKTGIWQTTEATQAAVYGQVPGQIKVQDVNNDGKINASDFQIIGSFQPQYTGGITNRFSYKGIDLSFVTTARIGQMVVVPYLTADGTAQGYDFFGNGRVNEWKVNYWTPTNPVNDFPRPDASSDKQIYSSTLGYRDGSYIKMRSINLGYTFAPALLAKTGISSLRIYVNCTNPFIIWSPLVKSGLAIDPEGNGYGGVVASTAPNGSVPGGSNGGRVVTVNMNNPPSRIFQLGVNVKF
jgi:TonB-linked SusC/RagA family outer membrane protein